MISILLASYNGEKFIREQLESILKQSYTNFTIYISDDGSGDKTVSIIKEYEKVHKDRLVFLESPAKRDKGAKNNFLYLLDKIEDEYIMFSDQDDVWHEDKILLSLKKMQSMEKEYGKNVPLALHTDLSIVNENLEILSTSMYREKNFDKINTLPGLLVENKVTGNTLMINKALQKLYKRPKDCLMHDWYLALIASVYGKLEFIDRPLVMYRQHEGNLLGAGRQSILDDKVRLGIRENYRLIFLQAFCILQLDKAKISKKDLEVLEAFVRMESLSRFKKILYIIKYGFFKAKIFNTLTQMISI